MKNINSLLGNRIRMEREAQHIQQKDLANIVGVAPSTIQRYEAGTFKAPKLPVIESIAKCLGVNPMWLLGKSEQKYSDNLNKATISKEQYNQLPTKDDMTIEMFKKLDNEDKAEIRGIISQMLKADKYSDNKKGTELQHA